MIYKTFEFRAVAIERDEPISDVPCGDCHACCVNLSPILTPQEFMTAKYMYTMLQSPEDAAPTIAVPRDNTGCFYLKSGKCSIYDDRPLACRQFDCRKGHYPPFKELVLKKFNIDLNDRGI